MAKIQLGANITGISGKQGGTVYSRNRFGAYTRNKTIPVNIVNTKTTAVRNNFRTAATAWKSLTTAARESWNAFANNYTYINVFGESKKLTGFQLFVGGHARRAYMGIATPDSIDNPVPAVAAAINALEFVWDGGALIMNNIGGAAWNNATPSTCVMWASAEVPQSQGYGSNKNKMRYCGFIVEPGDTVINGFDTTSVWSNAFGMNTPNTGQNATWITLQMIDNASGIVTNTQTFFAPII